MPGMKVYEGTLDQVLSSGHNFWTNLYQFEVIDVSGTRLTKLEAAPETFSRIQGAQGSRVSLYVKDGLIAGVRLGTGPVLHPAPRGYLVAGLLLLMLGMVGWIAIVPGLVSWIFAIPLLRQYLAYRSIDQISRCNDGML